MNTTTHRLFIIPFLIIFLFAACERADEDILKLMPDNTQLLFENEYVRVLNITLEPGDSQPLHKGGNRLIYALSNYTINYYQQEDTTEIMWNKGGVHWHEEGIHAVENVGETVADYLVIERKKAALPVTAHVIDEEIPTLAETGFSMEQFENVHARVCRITIPAGEVIPEHYGPPRLIYSLSDYKVFYTAEDKDSVEKEFNEGDFHWHPAGMHSVENIGDEAAEFIIFAFLQ